MSDATSPQWATPGEAETYGSRLLTGDRVRLRAATEDDLPQLSEWYLNPAHTTMQSGTYRIWSQAESIEEFKKRYANSASDPSGGGSFAVEALDSGELVGGVNLWGASLPARAAMLAIQIGEPFVSRGYGRDAVRVAARYGFEELGLNRIELQVFAYNTRAIRAYERAGFVIEGRRRETVFHEGRFHDDFVMAILARDWFAAKLPASD